MSKAPKEMATNGIVAKYASRGERIVVTNPPVSEPMEHQGILVKKLSEQDRRKEEYALTEKGLDLIPILVDMGNWSAEHDPHTAAPATWIALMKADREKMIQRIRETVQSGGSVFVGEQSLLRQFV